MYNYTKCYQEQLQFRTATEPSTAVKIAQSRLITNAIDISINIAANEVQFIPLVLRCQVIITG